MSAWLQPTGEVVFADFIELRDSMNTGFAQNVRMLLADRSRLAANAARRLGGNRTELTRGVYSPCDLCKDNPSAPPLWQFKAREIDHDKEQKLIEFRDATLELDGWPVFYTPYLSAPDPSVKRASGFLTPGVGNSNNIGFHIALPYFWAIDVDKDLTLAPRFTTKAGELLWPPNTGSASATACSTRSAASTTAMSAVGNTTRNTGDHWRGHINATGVWDLDETYRTGFELQRVSDQTYLLRFGFGDAAAERDDQPRLSRRLRAARDRPTSTPTCSSRCCRGSATRRSRSCCRSPTAPGSANPTRSAAGGCSTAIC